MSTPARRIEEFVEDHSEERKVPPKYVAHLLRMPLTDGKEAMIDPDEIVSVSQHRADSHVTVIRQRGDSYVYFVNCLYGVVRGWVADALAPDERIEEASSKPRYVGHLLLMPLTDSKESMIDPEEIVSVSQHRADANVTVIRQRGDSYVYFVDQPYEVVQSWVADALKS